jgi:hypothetical protein
MTQIGRILPGWLFVLSMAVPPAIAAETGACGIKAGMWGKSAAVCALADRPQEAERQFGDEALIRWETGIWVFQGVTCGIFSNEVNGSICTMQVECGHTMATTRLRLSPTGELNWGRPGDPPWVYCGNSEPAK